MGDCTYYFKAQFKTPAQAKKALPKITAFINEIREAYNFWHQYPSVNEKLFWNQFGRDFPLTNIYLVSLGAEASQALNCHSDLSGKLDFGQDEYNEPVTAPTTKVVGFHEPSPLLSPCGEALVAQQTPIRV